ncbi:helix-turn-helix domain-containing protein [Asticcacaulis biprosthecium]|uniref:helix-turn-helix domain-containing protein n=1 Tax=Asticcacaulis biprosthecium TaxID=76891 RepID=UPI0005901856|nr:helix-turn-helix domain-containing protein [Asticcacaulis biprosthecium]
MHHEDIKAALRKKYGSLKAFEEAHALPANSASEVIRGRAVLQTARVIARELGVSVIEVSPACKRQYDRLVMDYTSVNLDSHRLNVEAN